MPTICPTVTAETVNDYKKQLEHLIPFASRIHLDFMDGLFTKNRSISLDEAILPEDGVIKLDLHLMYMWPDLYVGYTKRFNPHLVIVQAEAKGDFAKLADSLHAANTRVGVALLQDTPVSSIEPAIMDIDHVLIFSGNLGHFGGQADLRLLHKVNQLRSLKPGLEIAWDGGINNENIKALADGGIDILNVGGYIQRADDPAGAYNKLTALITP